jgi:hypothetical protein
LDEVKATGKVWLDNLSDWNGRRWYSQPISLLASSDASNFGFEGVVVLPDGQSVPVSGDLLEREIKMSSTAREVIGSLRLLQATTQLFPAVIKNSSIQLVGDNQAAVPAINQFRSRSTEVNDALKKIFTLCVLHGFSVSAVWKPRNLLETEDLLSRQPDASDRGMRKAIFDAICTEFGVKISVDLFASHTWHVAPSFVSLFYTPGCAASQALQLDWRLLAPKGGFAWIFPPVRVISETVQMIERYRTDCVLVLLDQKASNWWVHLFTLPLKEPIRIYEIPRGTDSCKPSRRVFAKTANPGLFKLRALKIVW